MEYSLKTNKMKNNATFSEALEHMKLGGMATRESLGEMGVFIFMQGSC
jgi:hypothetical protein